MSFTLEGTITNSMPEKSGVSKKGTPWRSREYIIQVPGKYPKNVAFTVYGDKIDTFGLMEGVPCKVEIDIDAREWQGRWYNSITAFNVTLAAPQDNAPQPPKDPKITLDKIDAQPTTEDYARFYSGSQTRPDNPDKPYTTNDLPF